MEARWKRMKPNTRSSYDKALSVARGDPAPLARVALLSEQAHCGGDSRATYAITTWYLHKRFYRRNLRRAISLLKVAVKGHNADAAYDLPVSYETGTGVRQNLRKALALYMTAALLGDEKSVFDVRPPVLTFRVAAHSQGQQ
jgi:TPR repeat protein